MNDKVKARLVEIREIVLGIAPQLMDLYEETQRMLLGGLITEKDMDAFGENIEGEIEPMMTTLDNRLKEEREADPSGEIARWKLGLGDPEVGQESA